MKFSKNIITFDNLCRYIHLTTFGYIYVADDFQYYNSASILKNKCRIKLFTFDILNAWVIFKSHENGQNWIWIYIIQKIMILFKDVNSETILEKKPLKILHDSVSLEIFLPFSITSIFFTFSKIFLRKDVFQKVLLSVTFL